MRRDFVALKPRNDTPVRSRAFRHLCVCADDSEEENLESDLDQVGNHAFARMEGDVDKQRKLILQGQMSEAAMQKQHQRKYDQVSHAFY